MSATLAGEQELAAFTLAPGFRGAAVACGLKKGGALDLALVWSDHLCSAAGVFTTNRVAAAPVLHDRATLLATQGRVRGVIANAGCANACTGDEGRRDAMRMSQLAGHAIGTPAPHVLVLSTGVIGVPLDMEKVGRGIAALDVGGATAAAADVARAILTTDTRAKVASASLTIGGQTVQVRGFAKGAGMIHPDMATMLAVITTDAVISPERLDDSLRTAVARSFNRISVDGDMSTNDTVLVLASGASGLDLDERGAGMFDAALTEVCVSLARQIARDGEGATRLVEIHVSGAASEEQAHRVADAIGRSPLVKTAIHGGDPNWGRIVAAAGACGEPVEPERMRVWFGAERELQLFENGVPLPFDRESASALLRRDPAQVTLDLGLGKAAATVWTCDLSAEYVSINADYTT